MAGRIELGVRSANEMHAGGGEDGSKVKRSLHMSQG